jgi:hypothetical protein
MIEKPKRTRKSSFVGIYRETSSWRLRWRFQAKTGEKYWRKARKGDIEKIIIPGEGDKEQEVGVHQEVVPEKKAGSVWSWYEEFAAELSKTFITKKRKKSQKDTK